MNQSLTVTLWMDSGLTVAGSEIANRMKLRYKIRPAS